PGAGDRARRWWRGRPTACRTGSLPPTRAITPAIGRPSRDRPAHAIPLSPFRAELGRGRRLRRADALLAERDLESSVRALPGDGVYLLPHQLGHEDELPHLA